MNRSRWNSIGSKSIEDWAPHVHSLTMAKAAGVGKARRKDGMANGAAAKSASGASRNDILDAALKIFGQNSFEGASLQEIAQRANIGQPLLHYHFGNKEGLWKAAVEYALEDLKRFYETVAMTTVDLQPVDILRVSCRSFLNFASKHPEHALILVNEMRAPGERFEWLTERYLKPIHQYLDGLIEAAVERGQIKDIPPVHLTNTVFISLVHFFTIGPMLDALYNTDVRDPSVVAAHIDHTMKILFDGIVATKF